MAANRIISTSPNLTVGPRLPFGPIGGRMLDIGLGTNDELKAGASEVLYDSVR